MSKKSIRKQGHRLSGVIMLFYLAAFLLLAFRNGQVDPLGVILAVAVPASVFIGTHLIPRLFPADGLLLSLTNFLCALGILVLYDTNPSYAVQQAIAYGFGLAAMVFCIYLIRIVRHWSFPIALMIPCSLLLLLLPVLFGKETNGAKNWIAFGPVSFQPSEVVKLSSVLILSYFMSRHRFLPWLLFSALCLGLLMLQKDLGTALMYYGLALMLYWASSGNLPVTLMGLGAGAASAVLGYRLFSHVRVRVAIWQNPWADYDNTGYQLVQSLVAIASGGLFGVGLGLGDPTVIPVYESDFIFSVICEQFGVIFGLCVLLIYVAMILRGVSVAVSARKSFHGLLAMGCTVLIGLQAFVIVAGVIKLIPLTGVTLPFVSYGGTSLIASMCLSGLLQGVASLNEDDLSEDNEIALTEQHRRGGRR